MKPEAFEAHLARQPLRPPPAAWREEIVQAALASTRRPGGAAERRTRAEPWWREWLWPSPAAWASLAATWGAILFLNHLAAPPPAAMQFARTGGRTPSVLRVWFDQAALPTSFAGKADEPADRRPLRPISPRSERRSITREV